jgi:hypothetical protein
MIKEMRQETVEEFLQRGGTIEKIPQVLNTVGSWWGVRDQSEPTGTDTQQVPWKSMQPDSRMDSEDDDKKYWTQLNSRCDKLIKKMKKEGKIT